MKNLSIVLFGTALISGSAFASGFECREGNGYNVRLYNDVLQATRTPAVLVVSHDQALPRTLLKAGGAEIRKHNRANTVQYVADGDQMGLEKVILQIAFKEGRETLVHGEQVDGQLILVDGTGDRDVVHLTCERYLKH